MFIDPTRAGRRFRLTRFERLTAFAMLILLLLTGAFGGYIRECFGQNGHHAIEGIPGGDTSGLKRSARDFRGISALGEEVQSENSCIDRLLFTDLLRPSTPIAKPSRLRHGGFSTSTSRAQLRDAIVRANVLAAGSAKSRAQRTSAAFRELRTVVLLN